VYPCALSLSCISGVRVCVWFLSQFHHFFQFVPCIPSYSGFLGCCSNSLDYFLFSLSLLSLFLIQQTNRYLHFHHHRHTIHTIFLITHFVLIAHYSHITSYTLRNTFLSHACLVLSSLILYFSNTHTHTHTHNSLETDTLFCLCLSVICAHTTKTTRKTQPGKAHDPWESCRDNCLRLDDCFLLSVVDVFCLEP